MTRLLGLYQHLPAPLRSGVAALRGLQLRRWRYGPETEELVASVLERERWTPAQWRLWEEEQLGRLLHRAATRVPHYRDQWAARRRRGDRASFELLENWPVLEKQAVRVTPRAFLADDCSPSRMFAVSTSGTTGMPLSLWRSRETNRAYYAMLEARLRVWNGVSRLDPWGVLGGQLVVPVSVTRPPFWVWNPALNQLYLSSNHVSESNVAAMMAAVSRYGVTHLITYASSAAALARASLARGIAPGGPKVVITNAEPVSPDQRQAIGAAFGARVRETYGMVETVAGASECADGSLHMWPDAGYAEFLSLEGDHQVQPGESGRIVATGLLNHDMPLVRYAVGDLGRRPLPGAACSCGRTLPVVGGIEGRSNDMLRTPDGRLVFWINPVFYGLPIQEAQVIQEDLGHIRVLYAPGRGFTEASADQVRERLLQRLGDVRVDMVEVSAVPRGPNGKFRTVVSKLQAEA